MAAGVLRVLCIDSNKVTQCESPEYLDFVKSLVSNHGPFHHILCWDSLCTQIKKISELPRRRNKRRRLRKRRRLSKIKHRSRKRRRPYVSRMGEYILPYRSRRRRPHLFMEYILYILENLNVVHEGERRNMVELYVTTDAKIIKDRHIYIEDWMEYADVLNHHLAFVNIYYVGDKEGMNYGLNVVFGNVTPLQYFVNDISQVHPVKTLEEIQAIITENKEADIYEEEFLPSLVSRVKYLQATLENAPNDALLHQLQDMRKRLIEMVRPKVDTKLVHECYKNHDGQRLECEIRLFRENAKERKSLILEILDCFDCTPSLQLSDSSATTKNASNVLDQIDPSCIFLMVQTNPDSPLLEQNSSYVRNPLAILKHDALCESVFKRFEMQTLTFETVLKMKSVGTSGQEFESVYTGATCRPFALDPCNWPRVHLNSIAISHLFEKNSDDRKLIYGNKLLWNLAFLCLLKKQVGRLGGEGESVLWNRESVAESVENALRKFYNEIFKYPLTLHMKIALPFKGGFPLYIAIWYINRVAPIYAENESRNVLRMRRTRTLFDLYKEYGRREAFDTEGSMTFLENRVNIWNLWNKMIKRRNDPDFEFEVRASYQNYVVIEDKIVLLSGPLQGSPSALVAGFRPALISHLFGKLTANSSRYQDLSLKGDDGSEGMEEPCPIELNDASDQSEPSEFPFHIDIDPFTGRPLEICPKTGLPAKECAPADEYDIKSGSYAKVFRIYCTKKKKYPQNPSQLVLIHNRYCAKHNVSPRHIQRYMDHIFQIHQPMMDIIDFYQYCECYRPYIGW